MSHNQFTCIIVDDEPKAVELLKKYIHTYHENIKVINTFTNSTTAAMALAEQQVDILFLDISMPGKTGIELLRQLPGLSAEVIFVTAYPEYALNAFEFSPTGYLLKPIDVNELQKAVDKAIERILYKF